jgi:hypothetical protein
MHHFAANIFFANPASGAGFGAKLLKIGLFQLPAKLRGLALSLHG